MSVHHLVPTAGDDLLTMDVKPERFAGFTMTELRDTREAMILIADILAGLLCQPRYLQVQTPALYNAAGDVLDVVEQTALVIADKIEDEVERRVTVLALEPTDAELGRWLLIRANAERMGDEEGLDRIAQLATDGRPA